MITIITTNVATENDALKLGKEMIENNLIVCSNIQKVVSQYRWKGEFLQETEYKISFKTSLQKKKSAIKYLNANHPYEIPMISSVGLEVNNSYMTWMDIQLG